MDACFLGVAQAARAIRDGRLSSEDLVRACLQRVAERDPEVQAWLCIDASQALGLAREQDKLQQSVRHGVQQRLQAAGGLEWAGPVPRLTRLHGVPFGIKDVIDTADLPTTYNSRLFHGYRPARDASCVTIVREAGAVPMGKTDTVEFASFGRRAATRNPHHLGHTPGGSSSGSAAAVADFQIPFAFGTQTGGSIIRPASFNGIYALKPTWGRVSTYGTRLLAASLDTIGWYARSIEDLQLIAQCFFLGGETDPLGDDGRPAQASLDDGADVATAPHPRGAAMNVDTRQSLVVTCGAQSAARQLPARTEHRPEVDASSGGGRLPSTLRASSLRVGLCRSPQWSQIEPAGELALMLAVKRLREAGVQVQDVTLPASYEGLADAQSTIMYAEAQVAFLDLASENLDRLDPGMRAVCAPTARVPLERAREAYRLADRCRADFEMVFDACDVLLTPASPGEAPEGLHGTGRPIFNGMWTVLHAPCLAIPCTRGPAGLPVGVQLVAPCYADESLLAMAAVLAPLIDITPCLTDSALMTK